MCALVSVVIPVFNSEHYIADCIDSVLAQSYSHFEIILVDDGSTDSSFEIIQSYQANEKIKCFQIEHSGQSVARNFGIEKANGKYLIFIDSDDCWNKNTLEATVSLAEDRQLDMVIFNAESFVDDKITDGTTRTILLDHLSTGFKPGTYIRNAPKGVFTGGYYLTYQLDSNKFFASAVLYLYKIEYFKNIRFVPNIIHEDNVFTMELLVKNGSIMALPKSLYRRRIREDSIMTRPKSMENVNGYLGAIRRMGKVCSITSNDKIKKANSAVAVPIGI